MSKRTQIDASYYPHIIDAILDEALKSNNLSVRGVCKDWAARVDKHNAAYVALDLARPPLEPPMVDYHPPQIVQNHSYMWLYEGATLPTPYLYRSLNAPLTEITMKPWIDIKQEARMLDIRSCVEFARSGLYIGDFQNLDTVRLVQDHTRSASFDTIALMPHVRRVIFKDGPVGRGNAKAGPPAGTGTCMGCERGHIEKVVVNSRTPVLHSQDKGVFIPRMGLKELVVIFHGWKVMPHYNPDAYDPDAAGDARNDIRALIVAALRREVQVTVVNIDLLDLRRKRRMTNYESYQGELEEYMGMDLEEHGLNPDEVLARIKWLSLDEYKAKIGEKEFKIETMTDALSQS